MSHDPSRKQFLAKLLGLGAAFSLLPRLFAKGSPVTAAPEASAATPVAVRPETRAIARDVNAT